MPPSTAITAAFASAGAVLGVLAGYACQLHLYAFTAFGVVLGVSVTASIAHVAMGMLFGSFVVRPLYVHSLNMLLLAAALTMLLIPAAAINSDAFTPYGMNNPITFTDNRILYNSDCLTWPSGNAALFAPDPAPGIATCIDLAGDPSAPETCPDTSDGCFRNDYQWHQTHCCICGGGVPAPSTPGPTKGSVAIGFAWHPATNMQRVLVDIVSLQSTGGNASKECGGNDMGNASDWGDGDHEHCSYTYRNFQQQRSFPFFPKGHACSWEDSSYGSNNNGGLCSSSYGTLLEVDVFSAPSAESATLVNLLLIPLYLLAAILFATAFPHDTGVRAPDYFAAFRAPKEHTAGTASHRNDRVSIDHVVKRFGPKTAVNDVTATMREGEVFALLGHNGAGKSTLFQMLAGNLTMTDGSASVYGHDTELDTASVRRISGLCSQDDVLWPQLSGTEHVELYLALRGQASGQEAVTKVLEELNLTDVAVNPVSTYSGGMKRRLSVALSCIGDSVKVLFFDEPTTGLDPINGRLVWQLLQRAKKGRIVILTTHSMEEAELLADRIGVMNNGELRAYGTPIYLKTSLGGNTDRFRTRVTLADGASAGKLESEFRALAPDSRLVSTATKGETVVVMGVGQRGLENVENLFAWLNDSPLVDRWRVFNMTLEDVFTLVGGRDHDTSTNASPTCACFGRCCRCYMGKEETDLEAAPIDLRAANAAVANMITVTAPATATDQVLAVIAKNVLLLFRGSWKSLLVIFVICVLPIVVIDHFLGTLSGNDGGGDGDFGAIMLTCGFGIAPSLILPWLVVVAVQDNAGGLLELMVLQGLRIRNHVIGLFGYTFFITFVANLSILAVFAITGAPMIIHQSAGGFFLLLFAMAVASIWTAAVAVLLTSVFRSTGMAAGVTGFFTIMLMTAALTLVMIKTLISSSRCDINNDNDNDNGQTYNDDDGFFSPRRKYPVALNLAPYFGYFRALVLIGNTGNTGCDDRSTTDGKAAAGLGLTLVQAVVFFALGLFIYARRVANRVLLPKTAKTTASMGDTAPLLGSTGSLNRISQSSDKTGATIGRFEATRKVYTTGGTSKVALKGLDLAVPRGQFLGVLGPNGAGKSTAFNIMGGLLSATSGDAFVNGRSVTYDCEGARQHLGECPQFPRLWGDLTVFDHLGLYAALRGLPSPYSFSGAKRAEARTVIKILATVMQLGGASLHKPAKALSGGMKRRLSLAIALTGCPPLTVLDEPTTGLDPITRRDVWDLLAQLQQKDENACVISTHSMEEADTLCNRIAIISRGELRVSGTQEELKRQFGTGFTVTLTVTDPNYDVEALLTEKIDKDAAVKTRTGRVCSCHVPKEVELARLFRALCDADAAGHLQDWLVSETTLEDVFIRVVQQHEEQA